MSEKRTLLSRPRTKVYDCNYNIGEKYYRPMVDQLDRKYSGRASLPPFPSTSSTFASGTGSQTRLKDDDFSFPSTRLQLGRSLDFESQPEPTRRSRLLLNGSSDSKSLEDDLEEDIINSMNKLKAIRAAKASSVDGSDDFASPILNGSSLNGITSRQKKLNFSSKILDSVGISDRTQESLEDEILKRRTVKLPSLFDDEPGITKWSKLRESSVGGESAGELAAKARARQSRARIADIENEMDAAAERGAARERRINNIKALIAGEDAYPDAAEAYRSKKVSSSSRTTSKKVSF